MKFYLSVFVLELTKIQNHYWSFFLMIPTLGLSINSIHYQVASTVGRSLLEFHTGFNFLVIVTNKRDCLKRQALPSNKILPSNIGTNIRTSNNKKALTYLHHSLIVECLWWNKNVKSKVNDYHFNQNFNLKESFTKLKMIFELELENISIFFHLLEG